jgi:hypothetical protein
MARKLKAYVIICFSIGVGAYVKREFSAAASSLLAFCSWLSIVAPGLADSAASRHTESLTIEANKVLPGIWRLPPRERQMQADRFSVMGPELYCRVGLEAPGYTFNCFELDERSARAKLDADVFGRVHLSWKFLWGTPQCRWVFDGKLQSSTEMYGRYGATCPAGNHDEYRWKVDRMRITKVVLSETAPDIGGQAALLKRLLEEMANGQVTEPYTKPHFISANPNVVPLPDAVQERLMAFLTPDTLRSLGKIAAVIHVGDYTPIVGWWFELPAPPPPPRNDDNGPRAVKPVLSQPALQDPLHNAPVYGDKRPVYAVEFENGERLCTFHFRPDRVLDQFQCI